MSRPFGSKNKEQLWKKFNLKKRNPLPEFLHHDIIYFDAVPVILMGLPNIDRKYQIEEQSDPRKTETDYWVKKDGEKRKEDYKKYFGE